MTMTRVWTIAAAIGVGGVGSTGVAAAANTVENAAESRVEARLSRDARLKDDSIRVSVDDGVATLRGEVDSIAEKARAEKLARVRGVKRVDNKLDVDSDAKDRAEDRAEKAKDRIEDNADRAKDRIDERADRAKERVEDDLHGRVPDTDVRGRKIDRAADKPAKTEPGAELSDTWITTKVKTQFVGEDVLRGSDISVDTNQDGVVTLTGTVPSEAARARAVEIARTTKGVRKLEDHLRLAPDRK
jgi:hyperosmotically inducible periplasmic protein